MSRRSSSTPGRTSTWSDDDDDREDEPDADGGDGHQSDEARRLRMHHVGALAQLAAQLEPPVRLNLWAGVFSNFFPWVWVCVAVVLLTGNVWLLLAQAAVFAVGVAAGPASTPYAWLYRTLVRPRLGPPSEMEDATPPRFAQLCGLAFAGAGLGRGATCAPVRLRGAGLGVSSLADFPENQFLSRSSIASGH